MELTWSAFKNAAFNANFIFIPIVIVCVTINHLLNGSRNF